MLESVDWRAEERQRAGSDIRQKIRNSDAKAPLLWKKIWRGERCENQSGGGGGRRHNNGRIRGSCGGEHNRGHTADPASGKL